MFRIATSLLATAAICAPAFGQSLNSAAEKTAACLQVADAGERLACFDNAAPALSRALKDQPITLPSRSDAAPAPAATPAPAQPDLPKWADAPAAEAPAAAVASTAPEAEPGTPLWARLMPRSDDADEVDEIIVSVTRILRNNVGRHFFLTSDGQEWEQTIVEPVKPPKGLPAKATISESFIGSPTLSFDDGPAGAYKVRRTK
jgi:hypothetical protein